MTTGNAFGAILRAYRLGYGWSEKYQCFVRIGADGPPFQIEVRPAGLIPMSKGRKSESQHVIWWDTPEILDLIDGLPVAPLRGETFSVGEEGRRL